MRNLMRFLMMFGPMIWRFASKYMNKNKVNQDQPRGHAQGKIEERNQRQEDTYEEDDLV